MESITGIVEIIQNTGFAVVLMAYFLIKDWKFNQQILDTLGAINTMLNKLEIWHASETKEDKHGNV